MPKIHQSEAESAAAKASNHPIPTERIEIGKQLSSARGINKNRSRKFSPQNVTHTIIEPCGLRDCPVPQN